MKGSRQLEFIAVFQVEVPTKEGDAYVYCAVDSYSEFLFHTGVEPDRKPETILKHVKLLVEHPDFKIGLERFKNFTLVFHKFEELAAEINKIIKPLGGSMMVSDAFVTKEFTPIMEHLFASMAREGNKKS